MMALAVLFVGCPKPTDSPEVVDDNVTLTFLYNDAGSEDYELTMKVKKGVKKALPLISDEFFSSWQAPGGKMFGGWVVSKGDIVTDEERSADPTIFEIENKIQSYTKNTTFVARWGTPVTVTFDKKNGTVDFGEQQMVKEFPMPLNAIDEDVSVNGAPTGKEFAGWAEENTKQVIARNGQMFQPKADCTLDAIWMGFNSVDANTTFSMGGGKYGRELRGGSHENGTKYRPIQVKFTKKFEMSDHEVTQKEWALGTGVSQKDLVNSSEDYIWSDNTDEYDFYPILGVTWEQAVAYCNKLTIKDENLGIDEICYTLEGIDWNKDIREFVEGSLDGVQCDFTKKGYRLPTEAEWEYCAKDIEDTTDESSSYVAWAGTADENMVDDYAVRGSRADGVKNILKPVMSKLPNAKGYYDMSGSVWEWCWNSFAYYPDSDEVQIDYLEDQVPVAKSQLFMYRGGGWDSGKDSCRVTNRNDGKRSQMLDNVGFRVCRTVVTP